MIPILIASTISADGVGGLASYQRCLASAVQSTSFAETQFFQTSSTPNPPIWMSLASRPWTHPVLEPWIQFHYRSQTRSFDKQGIAVVHFVGTGWDFLGFAMHTLARRLGARFTIFPAVHPGQWGDDHLDIRLYRLADAVMCQSQVESDALVQRGLDARRVVSVGLPPMCRSDGDGAALRQQLRIGNRPTVLFLGARTAEKGYPALLAAWCSVTREVPDAVLVVAGPGPAGDLAVHGDSIRDIGVVDEATKASAFAACDVFCLPSSHESFGIVFVEAWSYGKPVVCGTAAAPREYVEDSVTGMWANQDPMMLAKKLAVLLKNPQLARQLGSAGLHLQSQRFTTAKMLEAHRQAWAIANVWET